MLRSALLPLALLLSAADLSLSAATDPDAQKVLASEPGSTAKAVPVRHDFTVSEAILQAVEGFADPVDAYLSLRPKAAAQMAEPRLIHVMGTEEPEWMTVGDKMRLRRRGLKFMDVTEYQDLYTTQVEALAGQASMSCFPLRNDVLLLTQGVQTCQPCRTRTS